MSFFQYQILYQQYKFKENSLVICKIFNQININHTSKIFNITKREKLLIKVDSKDLFSKQIFEFLKNISFKFELLLFLLK
ncbi:MAG: Uncharacterised protein [SAR116 cluster bacterium]|nr:MAG: Uncharacterised protein [SAR116 cluster bacterium]